MKARIFLSAVVPLVALIAGLLFLLFSSNPNGFFRNSEDKYIGLDYFSTYTVDVVFIGEPVKTIFGYGEMEMGNLFLKKFNSLVQNKFNNSHIRSSQYGRPYSFEKAPLNLAIKIEVFYGGSDPLHISMQPVFERSLFHTLLKSKVKDPVARQRYNKLLSSGGEFVKPTRRFDPLNHGPDLSVVAHNRTQFEKQIDRLCEEIVSEMNPHVDQAIELERRLLDTRR